MAWTEWVRGSQDVLPDKYSMWRQSPTKLCKRRFERHTVLVQKLSRQAREWGQVGDHRSVRLDVEIGKDVAGRID